MNARTPRPRPLRGMTLVEMMVALVLSSFVALLIYGAVATTTDVNRDVYGESEVTDLAARLLDEMARRMGARAVPEVSFTHTATAQAFRFREQIGVNPDGSPRLGVWTSGTTFLVGGALEYRWVADGTISEPALGLDQNGDGDALDAVPAGHMEVRVYDAAGAEVSGARRTLGATGRLRVLANDAGAGPLLPIFSRIGGAALTGGERAVQLNLRVVHDPIAGPGGPEVHAFTLTRVVTARMP